MFAIVSIQSCKSAKMSHDLDKTSETNTTNNSNFKYLENQIVKTDTTKYLFNDEPAVMYYTTFLFTNKIDTFEILFDLDRGEITNAEIQRLRSNNFEIKLNSVLKQCKEILIKESTKNEHIKYYLEMVMENYDTYKVEADCLEYKFSEITHERLIDLLAVRRIYLPTDFSMKIDYSPCGKIDDYNLTYSINESGEIIDFSING